MEHFIIGTAGHIDHGKTALIKALTGRDTDTMKEEKQRGISIDLGFTYFSLENGTKAGIVDVPGHEKFLPNMLAGACGMDLVLLVIALDDGVMPQTREHMDILTSLRISQGIVVLTKLDKVEPEWADMMEEEIRKELEGTICSGWEIIRVSSTEGTGIAELKKLILQKTEHLKHSRNVSGCFRLPIDRVLSPKGLGTVVAGTLMEGVIQVEDEVMLYPTGIRSRVRSIQVHGENVPAGFAGQRVALLLAGVKKEEVSRGHVAAEPDSLQLSERLDARIELHRDCRRVMKNQSNLHLHIGTTETLCRIVLFGKDVLEAGEACYGQLIPREPLAVKKWDRFVLRYLSPLETVGGGVILDAYAAKHRRKDGGVLVSLKNQEEDRLGLVLCQWICEAEKMPLSVAELQERAKVDSQEVQAHLKELEREKCCVLLSGRKRDFCWSREAAKQQWQAVSAYLDGYHRAHPYREGSRKNDLKNACCKNWSADAFDAFFRYLLNEGSIREVREGLETVYALAGFAVMPEEGFEQWRKQLTKQLADAGFGLVNCMELKPEEETEEAYREQLSYLCREKMLVCISDDFFTTPEIAETIKEKVAKYFKTNEVISFASLRDLLGNSRKSAKPLMAWLDQEGITAWCGRETERKQGRKEMV
ncbi:MAG: selenocysteine-specific translation elongation factor [Roseburia sp.]